MRVYAYEIDGSSDLAKVLLRSFDEPLKVVAFGVDDRAGDHDVVVELDRAVLHHMSGAAGNAVPSAELRRRAVSGEEATVASRLAPVQVPVGMRVDGVFAFFAPGESLRDVRSIGVRLDGEVREVPGKYFSLGEKRAIDSARGAVTPRSGNPPPAPSGSASASPGPAPASP